MCPAQPLTLLHFVTLLFSIIRRTFVLVSGMHITLHVPSTTGPFGVEENLLLGTEFGRLTCLNISQKLPKDVVCLRNYHTKI